ncbi:MULTISPECIES: hypothetical protein [Rhizobium]|uniref:hypothetical protein n=1 Tax=Rhizobium TaxID=379 RepID=UPI0017AE03E2|nr:MULTISPECIES: hypothetical protein [Rhizobium]
MPVAAGGRRLLGHCPVVGHEAMETTLTYLHAHLVLKGSALAELKPYERAKAERFRPSDRLLEFLNAL